MNRRKLAVAVWAALGLLGATLLMADVITAPPLSGNFALTFSGFELLTPTGASPIHLDIKGEGLVSADGSGDLTGTETFTAANPATPETGPVAAQCAGSLAGSKVAEPGDGTAQITLQFSPTSAPPTGVGAQDACIPTEMTLSCVEVLPDSFPIIEGVTGPPPPSAIATPLPLPPFNGNGPGKRGRRHHRRHPNLRVLGPGPNGTPIVFPFFFPSGASKLKCVVTSVTTTSTIGSFDGALLSFDLQQTGPASIVVPPPCPQCVPPPCVNCPPTPCPECVPPPCLNCGCPDCPVRTPQPTPCPQCFVPPPSPLPLWPTPVPGGGPLPNR